MAETGVAAPFYTSRSDIQDYKSCGFLRWVRCFEKGPGYGPGLEARFHSLPRLNGTILHGALAALLKGGSLEGVIKAATEVYRTTAREVEIRIEGHNAGQEWLIEEQTTLLEGLIRAWARLRLPKLLAEYELVNVESQVNLELAPGLVIPVRLDALLRQKGTGLLVVKEWKTLGYLSDDWLAQWSHKSQLLQQAWAISEMFPDEPFVGISVEGIVKGKMRKERRKNSSLNGKMIQDSPLCYLWTNGVEFETGFHYGFDHKPVWELIRQGHFTMADWVEWNLPALEPLFSVSPPLKPAWPDVRRWVRQTIRQERKIQRIVQRIEERPKMKSRLLDLHFAMNDDHCLRYFGHPCEFVQFCFDRDVRKDPVGSGLYQTRIRHFEERE